MSDTDLRDQAVARLKATTISYPRWLENVRKGVYTPKDGSGTNWGRALALLAQIGAPTPPPPSVAQPFGPNSTINKPVPAGVAIHPDTPQMINGNPNFVLPSSSPYREWLGPRDRAYYAKVASFSSWPQVSMYVNFVDGSGYACGTTGEPVGIPTSIQQALARDDNTIASYDRCMYLVDGSGNAVESYRTTPPGFVTMDISCDSGRWNSVRCDHLSGAETTYVGYGNGFGASGSGILIGCGVIRPEDMADLSSGSVIPHALRLNAEFTPTPGGVHPFFVPPATGAGNNGDWDDARAIPTGARVFLSGTVGSYDSHPDVVVKPEPWRSALRKILRTLQKYGMVYVDGSGGQGSGGIETVVASLWPTPPPWAGIGDYQRGIPYSIMGDFRVVDWRHWTGA